LRDRGLKQSILPNSLNKLALDWDNYVLFNSIEFIFFFLPITYALYAYTSIKIGKEAGIISLVLASLFFYGWWNPAYLVLLLLSMVFNFQIGKRLGSSPNKKLLCVGVTSNLALIAYYKYAGFLVFNLNTLTGAGINVGDILLPLAISFFTFQQIAYLVDSYRGITKEYNFVHYSLFVSFFPQLIAGPIVHHKEMLPQFDQSARYSFNNNDFAIGISIFAIGLFKKTVLADGIAGYASPAFSAADSGIQLDFFEAWGGALAYTFQLYFDFSGYSDMAIGVARMFGIILPLNFYSPYKATNISEFWKRWHMTLSRFLRDYVYIPLGGNRTGNTSRFKNLFITMLLGGLWHGAGWNFVIWGALHGIYLICNHGWQSIVLAPGNAISKLRSYQFFSWALTFIAVVVSWVFFRAETFTGATSILQSMVGLNGASIPNAIWVRCVDMLPLLSTLPIETKIGGGVYFVMNWVWVIALISISVLMPSTHDLFRKQSGDLTEKPLNNDHAFWPLSRYSASVIWSPTTKWSVICSLALVLGMLTLSQVSEFLYFQF